MKTAHLILAAGGVLGTFQWSVLAMPVVQEAKADAKAEFEKKLAAVNQEDAKQLFDLALWAEANGLGADSKRLLRKVIKIDKDHAEARKILGYVKSDDGKWVTERELERLNAKKEEEAMLDKGLRKYKGEWIPIADYEKFQQGLVPFVVDGETKWLTPVEKERIEKGMVLCDGQWVTPEEKENLAKGMFKVGEAWLSKEDANKAHADISNPWQFERDCVRLVTTCDFDFAKKALIDADASVRRVYDILKLQLPKDFAKIDLMMVNSTTDYQQLGNGVQDTNDALMSSEYACFVTADQSTQRVGGVAKYEVLDENNKEGNDNFSRFLLRHAAAEATARSFNFKDVAAPPWFTIGLGTYCERYWDPFNNSGVKVLGKWSVDALKKGGGVQSLKSFFDSFAVNRPSILQSGLLISYLVHGQLPEKVQTEWNALLASIGSQDHKGLEKAFIKLETSMQKYGEDAFLAYADQPGGQ